MREAILICVLVTADFFICVVSISRQGRSCDLMCGVLGKGRCSRKRESAYENDRVYTHPCGVKSLLV